MTSNTLPSVIPTIKELENEVLKISDLNRRQYVVVHKPTGKIVYIKYRSTSSGSITWSYKRGTTNKLIRYLRKIVDDTYPSLDLNQKDGLLWSLINSKTFEVMSLDSQSKLKVVENIVQNETIDLNSILPGVDTELYNETLIKLNKLSEFVNNLTLTDEQKSEMEMILNGSE